jgi:hypothetical protein
LLNTISHTRRNSIKKNRKRPLSGEEFLVFNFSRCSEETQLKAEGVSNSGMLSNIAHEFSFTFELSKTSAVAFQGVKPTPPDTHPVHSLLFILGKFREFFLKFLLLCS